MKSPDDIELKVLEFINKHPNDKFFRAGIIANILKISPTKTGRALVSLSKSEKNHGLKMQLYSDPPSGNKIWKVLRLK